MPDKKKVVKGLECCSSLDDDCTGCPYDYAGDGGEAICLRGQLMPDVLVLLKEQEKEIKALQLLVEWAEECDFGFDQFPAEYERYKDEIKDMKYIDGMIHVAKRTLEDSGAFEEGR